MAAQRLYPDEVRERAVRMTGRSAGKGPTTRRAGFKPVGELLGINPETLRGRVVRAEVDAGHRPSVSSSEAERIAELERENQELCRSNAILRSAAAFLRGGPRPPTAMMVDYIDAHRNEFGVDPICLGPILPVEHEVNHYRHNLAAVPATASLARLHCARGETPATRSPQPASSHRPRRPRAVGRDCPRFG